MRSDTDLSLAACTRVPSLIITIRLTTVKRLGAFDAL